MTRNPSTLVSNVLNIVIAGGVIASGAGLFASVLSAYLWSNGNIGLFIVLVSNMNVLASASSITILTFVIFANLWFYWVLLGEPKGAIGKTLHSISIAAVTISLNVIPSYLTIIYACFLIVLIVLRVRKIEKEKIRAWISKIFPGQTLVLTSLIGSLAGFLAFGVGITSTVTAVDSRGNVISGSALITTNELILINEARTSVAYFSKATISDLQITSQKPHWLMIPISSMFIEAISKSKN